MTERSRPPTRRDADAEIARSLLDWFGERERDVPWRSEDDPWRILVAEVMAQQTRIDTVIPYYRSFIGRFPTPAALAEAPLDDVLKRWEGLGYYARARHLHAAAGQIVAEHGGGVPSTVEELRALAGIGPYTAGAVASLAFGIAEPAVDGNARRVLGRLFDIEEPTPAKLERRARRLLAITPGRAAALNQAIMDLGGSVCTPRRPRCDECPVSRRCLARAAGTVADRPGRSPRVRAPVRFAASAIVRRDDRVLVLRRPERGLLGGLWDLPGTPPGDDDVAPTALASEISALGVEASVGARLERVEHAFSHFRLRLDVFEAVWRSGEPSSEIPWRWAGARDLRALAFPTYLRSLLPRMGGTA